LGLGSAFFLALIALCSLIVVGPSFALRAGGPSNFSLGGSAAVVHPGNGSPTAAELTAAGSGESHVNLGVPDGLKLRQVGSLATDYRFVTGSCASGSPRFTANVTSAGHRSSVFFYIGPGTTGDAAQVPTPTPAIWPLRPALPTPASCREDPTTNPSRRFKTTTATTP